MCFTIQLWIKKLIFAPKKQTITLFYTMKKIFLTLILSLTSLCMVMAQEVSFAKPNASPEAKAWFKKGKWKNGFKVKPYDHIDVQTFYEQYQKAPEMWDSIFTWLATVDPLKMEPSNNAMQWSHAYVKVLNQTLRTPENCQWEQHRRTIDLQWDVTGSERYHVTHSPDCLVPRNDYNEKKDVQNFGWDKKKIPTADQCLVIDSDPKHFYLFFPNDIHQATGIGKQPCTPRKIVIKIEYLK